MRRQFWQLPVIHTKQDRRVTWLELFYDLVFVALIAQIAHMLVEDASLKTLGKFAFLFLPAWWAWIGSTYYNDRFETFGAETRVAYFVKMLAVVSMAAAVHHAFAETGAAFALSYAAARGMIVFLWGRGSFHVPEFRPTGIRLTIGFGIAVAFFIVSAFVPPPIRYYLWAGGLAVDFITPPLTAKHIAKLPPFSIPKLAERFGLFTIIVLGEAIIGVVNGLRQEHHIGALVMTEVAGGLAIGFGLWWLYFDYVGRREPHGKRPYLSMAWAYLHLPLVMGIVAIGASLTGIIAEHADVVSPERTRLIAASVGVCLLSIAALELVLDREEAEPTHPLWSPLLKALSALGCFAIAVITPAVHPVALFGTLLGFILVQMVYGMYVWFTQELPDEPAAA